MFYKFFVLFLIPLFFVNNISGQKRKIINIDGSSTVYPITEAVAEEFQKINIHIKVVVGVSGTGGGFKRFGRGEIDISNASRPIKPIEEELCRKHNINYIELPIAYDGLAVIVNPKNTWCNTMRVSELKKLWEPAAEGKITYWNQIKDGWPNKKIVLFGPGVDSGTFDYFTEVIVGKARASRADYTSSEDDHVIVMGVAGDESALGYVGLAYYETNKDKLKLVAIDDETGRGEILPSKETIEKGVYRPLSRPIFIYVSDKSARKPEVKNFVEFYLKNAEKLVQEVGYIPLSKKAYELTLSRFKKRITGTIFGKETPKDISIENLLRHK